MRIATFVLGMLLPAGLLAQDPAPQGPPTPPAEVQEPAQVQPRHGDTLLTPQISTLTQLHNSMPHQLLGLGVVTGLDRTGSSDRGTRQALLNLARQLGFNLGIADVVGGSTALVTLTCSLPPFAKQGELLDVSVQVYSDATSLRGGELLRAELKGVDGKTYVVAQGKLSVAGYSVAGTNATQTKNQPTTGWIMNGGVVIEEEETSFYGESGMLELRLLNPGAFNVTSVAAGVRTALEGSSAKVTTAGTSLVRIELPEHERTEENATRILSLVGKVRVPVENPVKVMIDQASGVVLAGDGVLISPCVVGLTELTIAIVDEEEVVQPNEWAAGTTERVGRTRIEVQSDSTEMKRLGGATVSDLLQNLRTLGLTPAQLVSVFTALDRGGFLHATLEVR